uniref:Uncharacterized protein n=1 Tax=Meloidogyne javanica TaxID=6303 RepID=A0A915MBX0_MELJA
ADLESTVREHKQRINELESANKRFKECPPEGGVAAIQEELIRVKMREAESSLSLKEMRQKLAEFEQQWQAYMNLRGIQHFNQTRESAHSPPLSSHSVDEELELMEMETQNHVCTNQLKRQDDEIRRLREEKENCVQTEAELRQELRDCERKLLELQSELKEKNIMQRLKYTEALQTVAELRSQLAQIESKKAEKEARLQIRGSSVFDQDVDSVIPFSFV